MATQTSREEKLARIKKEQARKNRNRNLVIGAIVVAVIAVLFGLGYYLQTSKDTTGNTAKDVPANLSGTYSVMIGNAAAPTTIKLYEDFQCPACHDLELATGDQLRQAVAAGKVKVDLHMLAFLDRASTTNYSSRALNAAAAVLDTAGVDAFWKYHQLLYANQPAEGSAGLDDTKLVDLAVQAGADKSKVEPLIKDDTFHQWVVNATGQMVKDGINGTPSVFVNGKFAGDALGNSITAVQTAVAQ